MTRSYRAYGLVLASDIELPELVPCHGPPAVTLRVASLPEPSGRWFDIWRFFEERPWVRGMSSGDGYRLRYESMADFFVDPAGGLAIADPYACPPLTLRHFFLDQVLPLMLSARDIVLHASAVAIDGVCVAFLGAGGAGKSTLALSLGRLSFPVVSDDGLLVRREETWTAVPSYPGVRAWPDTLEAIAGAGPAAPMAEHSPKRRLRDGVGFAGDPLPLACVYLLDPCPAPRVDVSPVSARDLLVAMLGQMYRLDHGSAPALRRELERAGDLAASVPAWRVAHPRLLSRSHEVALAIVEHARSRVIDSCPHASGRQVRGGRSARAC